MKIGVPAKINLSLRILGRREDGFHELETLMVPVPAAPPIVTVTMNSLSLVSPEVSRSTSENAPRARVAAVSTI